MYGYIPSRIAKKLSMKITKNPSAMSFVLLWIKRQKRVSKDDEGGKRNQTTTVVEYNGK